MGFKIESTKKMLVDFPGMGTDKKAHKSENKIFYSVPTFKSTVRKKISVGNKVRELKVVITKERFWTGRLG